MPRGETRVFCALDDLGFFQDDREPSKALDEDRTLSLVYAESLRARTEIVEKADPSESNASRVDHLVRRVERSHYRQWEHNLRDKMRSYSNRKR
jgi:hypothetical protein